MRPQSNIALFDLRSEDSKSKTFDYSVSQSYHEVEKKHQRCAPVESMPLTRLSITAPASSSRWASSHWASPVAQQLERRA